jgi:hypothetical protein
MSMSLRDRIKNRREEQDNDMMLFLFPILSLLGYIVVEWKRNNVMLSTNQEKSMF